MKITKRELKEMIEESIKATLVEEAKVETDFTKDVDKYILSKLNGLTEADFKNLVKSQYGAKDNYVLQYFDWIQLKGKAKKVKGTYVANFTILTDDSESNENQKYGKQKNVWQVVYDGEKLTLVSPEV